VYIYRSYFEKVRLVKLNLKEFFFPETGAGGYTRVDGTVEFYSRINALLSPEMVVLDYGAGRGAAAEDPVAYRRGLQTLKGRVAKVIGMDIDPAVESNVLIDEAIIIEPNKLLPLPDTNVDLIVCDSVFEHFDDPACVTEELYRVLKPGGWICARTPNRWGYIGIGSRLIPNRLHEIVLSRLQPMRKAEDEFPTYYRLNDIPCMEKHFPLHKFDHFTYTWNSEPAYFGNFTLIWRIVLFAFRFTPRKLGAIFFIFLRKKPL